MRSVKLLKIRLTRKTKKFIYSLIGQPINWNDQSNDFSGSELIFQGSRVDGLNSSGWSTEWGKTIDQLASTGTKLATY